MYESDLNSIASMFSAVQVNLDLSFICSNFTDYTPEGTPAKALKMDRPGLL